MSLWDWFNECRHQFYVSGDKDRIRLTDLHHLGFALQETDPDGCYALFTEGSQLAQQLGEPWFVFFYDVWRVQALTSYKQDYRNVLELAVHCALEARKPHLAAHPWRLAAFNHLVDAYLGIDPLGYAEQLTEAMNYLDQSIEPGPNSHRYVLLGHQRHFAKEREDLTTARQLCMQELALVDQDDDSHRSNWFGLPCNLELCWLAWRAGDNHSLDSYLQAADELAPQVEQSQGERAEAAAWRAYLLRLVKEEMQARRQYRSAVARQSRLRSPASTRYFDAISAYHELAGDFQLSLRNRERELASSLNRGRWVDECKAQIRCAQLKARLGTLQPEDLQRVRASTQPLRRPEFYLAQIEQLEKEMPS